MGGKACGAGVSVDFVGKNNLSASSSAKSGPEFVDARAIETEVLTGLDFVVAVALITSVPSDAARRIEIAAGSRLVKDLVHTICNSSDSTVLNRNTRKYVDEQWNSDLVAPR